MNVSCYIGIGQLINHSEGLKYSCNWIKELAKDVVSRGLDAAKDAAKAVPIKVPGRER